MKQGIADHGTATPTLADLSRDEARRRELASFVRSKRQTLSPAGGAYSGARRRRVAGLRRSEIAEAAGISVDWYIRIEQARDLKLSTETLARLAQALQLDHAERKHLYRLAGHAPPFMGADSSDMLPAIQRMLDSVSPDPAYVLDALWNVIAWNSGAETLFGFSCLLPTERNLIRLMFMEERFRTIFCAWPAVAQCMLGHFRADSAETVGTATQRDLVYSLQESSAEFREAWTKHHVSSPFHWHKEVLHPTLGLQRYDTLDLQLAQPERYRVVTYIACTPKSSQILQDPRPSGSR